MASKPNLKTFMLSVWRFVFGRNRSLAGERHALQETP
jgi:hypothetical protein